MPVQKKSDVKSADIHLPYFKQGDDLHHHLENEPTIEQALEAHARQMEHTAQILREVKSKIVGAEIEMQADVHFISISGPASVIDALLAAELASERDWLEEEEDLDEDEFNDGEEE